MDTAAQPSEERFAFLGVQGRAAPAEGDKGGRAAHRPSRIGEPAERKMERNSDRQKKMKKPKPCR